MRSREPAVPLPEYPARRVALVQPGGLADVVHGLPVLSALRRRYPEAHLAWVGSRGREPLLRGHPDLDETLAPARAAGPALIDRALNYSRFLRRLRGRHFDLVIDLAGRFGSAFTARASAAPRRVGLGPATEGAHWFYTDVVMVEDPGWLHAVERYWKAAEALGAGDGPRCFRLADRAADRDWAWDRLEGCPRPWLVLAVGCRNMTRRWPPEHFALLAQQAHSHFGGTFVFVGGRADAAAARATSVRLRGPRCDLTGATSLPRLAALLRLADVVLANDTGPLHLAAALGRPVVAPYTCTRVALRGPYAAEAGAVETRVWCRGAALRRCDRMECMAELTPARLWPALKGILLQWEQHRLSA